MQQIQSNGVREKGTKMTQRKQAKMGSQGDKQILGECFYVFMFLRQKGGEENFFMERRGD